MCHEIDMSIPCDCEWRERATAMRAVRSECRTSRFKIKYYAHTMQVRMLQFTDCRGPVHGQWAC